MSIVRIISFLFFKFDANVIIPLLMMIFEVLNSIVQACVTIVVGFGDFIKKDNNIFNVCTSMEKLLHALVGELFCSRGYS
jgi:phage-related protein